MTDVDDEKFDFRVSQYSTPQLRFRAMITCRRGPHSECLAYLRELILVRKEANATDFGYLGRCYGSLQAFEEGVVAFTQHIANYESCALLCHLERALLLHQSAHFERAIEDYTRVIETLDTDEKPDLAATGWTVEQVISSRGSSFLASFRHGEAIRDYLRALEIEPKLLPARGGLALSYAGLGRADLAKREFEQGIQDDRKNQHRSGHLFANRGYVRLLWKEYELAVVDLTIALERSRKEGNPSAMGIDLWRRAFAYMHLDGELAKARKDLEEAFEVSPGFPLLEVGMKRISHLATDFDDYLPVLGDTPATVALRKLLPSLDRMNDRFDFIVELVGDDRLRFSRVLLLGRVLWSFVCWLP